MLLTVLTVPDCPNTPLMLERLQTALEGAAVDLDILVIEDLDAAYRWEMAGSPTLLLEGSDPFASLGVEASVSCRLYRDAEGVVSGAPSVTELRAALADAPAPLDGCEGPGRTAALDRAGRGRLAPAEGGLRAMQQTLLRAVVQSGRPPGPADLDRVAEEAGREAAEVLRELADQDFVTLDHAGNARAIYPFSTVASAHDVRIDAGPQVWAMCAVDALGIAAMLGRKVTLDTTDPLTDHPINVQVTPAGAAVADPPSVVALLGRRAGDGPAEQVCCATVNLFSSAHTAARWAALHPEVCGEVVTLQEAARLGQEIFGPLLRQG